MRALVLSAAFLLLFCGAFALVALRHLPPPGPFTFLLPLPFFAAGALLLLRLRGPRFAAIACAITLCGVALISLRVWPQGKAGGPAGGNGEQLRGRTEAGGALVESVLQVPRRYRLGPLRVERTLLAPAGARVSVFAAGLEGPRFMAQAAGGDILVSEPRQGRIRRLRDTDRDGVADHIDTYFDGLLRPHGLAFLDGGLVVAETGRLSLLQDLDGDGLADSRRTLSGEVPAGGGHWTRTVVAGRDRSVYLSAGSSCNACEEEDRRRAAVLRFLPPYREGEVYASGLRNSVGLALDPFTGALWGTENGRDMLGDDLPPDEINRIERGGDYGWPHCYGGRVPDPQVGSPDRCEQTLPATVELPAHSAPLGLAFGYDLKFPAPYRKMLYVAYHGSWNRRIPTGYKLVGIPFDQGRASGAPVDIVRGWLQDGIAWGRPVQPLVGDDGALYLSDDRAGAVYRIAF